MPDTWHNYVSFVVSAKSKSMTKKTVDLLLEKANTYEKLALFGNRKNFLTAIAQMAGLTAPLKQQINAVLNNLAATNPNTRDIQGRLMDALNNPNPDLGQVAQALRDAANAFPGDRAAYRQQADGAAQQVSQLMGSQEAQPEQVMQMPADRITGYPPIPADVQEKLSEMLSVRGDYIPFKADGRLGPQTRKALEIYQQKYNQGSKLPPGDDLYNEIRKSYNMWKMQERYESGEYSKPMTASPFGNR